MSNSSVAQAISSERGVFGDRSASRGRRGSGRAVGFVTALVEAFVEARAMAQETNRRFPFGGE